MSSFYDSLAADTAGVFLDTTHGVATACRYQAPGTDPDEAEEISGIPEYHLATGQGLPGADEIGVVRPNGESVDEFCRLWLDPAQEVHKDGVVFVTNPMTATEERWAVVRSLGNHGPLTAWLLTRRLPFATRGHQRR